MHQTLAKWTLAVTAAALVGVLASPAIAAAQVTDDQVQAAIDRGVAALLAAQTDKGWWSPEGTLPLYGNNYIGANEVTAMLALAYADVSMNNPKMEKGFKALLELPLLHTYTRALRIMVLAKLMPKLRREQADGARAFIRLDAKFLVDTQRPNGAWGYPRYVKDSKPPQIDAKDTWCDFSNTQIAILGLSEAVRSSIEIPEIVFKRTQDLYLKEQFEDGGWDYLHEFGGRNKHRDNPYGSMTAAAVASLFLTRDILYPSLGCPCRGDRSSGRVPRVDEAIDHGLDWLARHFSAKEHPSVYPDGAAKLANWLFYWLYSCERAGLASGIKYFGTHDWYAEGAAYIIRKQGRTGDWGANNLTCWAICFLAKGRAPILFNKLKFRGEWSNHPRDMANLVGYVSKLKEQPLQWQIVNLEVPVDEWHDAPILYITAESPLDFSEEEKAKLRRFTDNGGTILFEASCGHRAAKMSWERILKEVWPEFELEIISREHPIWTADQKITGRLPNLLGMQDGMRTFMFVSWQDMSCAWQRMSVTQNVPLFDLGGNLYVYSTDRRPLRARLATKRLVSRDSYVAAKLSPGGRPELTVARVKHGGDWYVGQNYRLLARLGTAVSASARLKLQVREAMPPVELASTGAQVAWLVGRKDVRLPAAEVAGLRKFMADGGLLVAESAMGDRRFDASFRELAGQLGLRVLRLSKDSPLLTGGLGSATGFSIDTVKFQFALRAERVGKNEPELYGLYLDDRMVGVYSPFDLLYCQTGQDAFDCRGYEAEDALAILTNILLWASAL